MVHFVLPLFILLTSNSLSLTFYSQGTHPIPKRSRKVFHNYTSYTAAIITSSLGSKKLTQMKNVVIICMEAELRSLFLCELQSIMRLKQGGSWVPSMKGLMVIKLCMQYWTEPSTHTNISIALTNTLLPEFQLTNTNQFFQPAEILGILG